MVANFGIPQCFQKWQLPASSSKFPNLATFELPKNCHIWLQMSMLIVGTPAVSYTSVNACSGYSVSYTSVNAHSGYSVSYTSVNAHSGYSVSYTNVNASYSSGYSVSYTSVNACSGYLVSMLVMYWCPILLVGTCCPINACSEYLLSYQCL